MSNIYKKLPKPFTVQAPLDDVSDVVFRQIVASCASPDLFFTEFVNVDGLQSVGREKLLHKLWKAKSDRPIIAQIWGKTPDNYLKTAKDLVGMGFDGIDINMGCPDKTVIKNGCCIALINNRELAKDIIQATKKGANNKVPVSVKTRIGFNDIDLTWHEFLLRQDIDAMIIHGRTKKEMSLVPAHWDIIENIRELRDKIAPKTIIVGNGDISNKKQAIEYANRYKLDGIMIGRGIFSDMFAFSDHSDWSGYTKEQRVDLFRTHLKLFIKTYKNRERSPNVMKKFAKIYINNFSGAKELRDVIVSQQTLEGVLTILNNLL
jgi:tRNA-dihydrouridine synthase